jgi:glycosyltransferase involved in cell wall biosynthesis
MPSSLDSAPKRVLFVDHVSRILGGAEINLVELLEHPPASWRPAVACAAGQHLSRALPRGNIEQFDYALPERLNTFRLAGRSFSILNGLRSWKEIQKVAAQLDAILTRFQPDAVISCTGKDHFAAAIACRKQHRPSIWWVNDIISKDFFSWPVRAAFIREARHSAARIVVVSNFAQRVLLDSGLPAQKVVTIANGIPLAKYQRTDHGELRRQIGISSEEPLIGVVGRFTPWKGQEFFLKIAQAWLQQKQSGHFVLVGTAFNEDQQYERKLREFVQAQIPPGRVHFVPFQQDIGQTLSDLDLLLHTSVKPEPFGRVLIEAMAVGTPVVAAANGGVPEIIAHNETGLLARPGELGSYLEQLQFAFTHRERMAALATAARVRVENHFTIERVRRQFAELVENIAPAYK